MGRTSQRPPAPLTEQVRGSRTAAVQPQTGEEPVRSILLAIVLSCSLASLASASTPPPATIGGTAVSPSGDESSVSEPFRVTVLWVMRGPEVSEDRARELDRLVSSIYIGCRDMAKKALPDTQDLSGAVLWCFAKVVTDTDAKNGFGKDVIAIPVRVPVSDTRGLGE